ncbi:hypothetical protein CTA1_6241 [Colletotrichum tanaceti]|uniref:Uncharacterized protein n=1 Tax=Colletotrichum tanaceti TaxID=1306861 RepID=A0A4V6DHC8_9PEZI|nr:hypothetical protein CTA1_6241 [Colletotrichum tanaceti]
MTTAGTAAAESRKSELQPLEKHAATAHPVAAPGLGASDSCRRRWADATSRGRKPSVHGRHGL